MATKGLMVQPAENESMVSPQVGTASASRWATVRHQATESEPVGLPVERFVRGLFRALNAAGVRYAVLRNYEGYPHTLHKPDMSLLASDRDVPGLIGAFEQHCAELGCTCVVHPGKRQNAVLLALWLEIGDDGEARLRTMTVDVRLYESFKLTGVHGAVPGLNYKVFFDEVRTRTVAQDGCEFHVLAQPDELILLFKQWKRKNTPEYRRRIVAALGDPEVRGWFERVTGLRGEPEEQLPGSYEARLDGVLWAMVRNRWGRHTPWRAARTHLRAALLWRRRHSSGPMVYYAGPDGCGKTTAVDAVRALLGELGIRYRYIYSFKRVLRFFMKRLGWLKKVVGGKRTAVSKASEAGPIANATNAPSNVSDLAVVEEGDRDTGSRVWRWRKRVTLLIGLADVAIGYVMSLPYRWRGDVVLVETSPYDTFIKYHMPEFGLLERVFGPLLPKPRRCVVLRATSESIFRRKPELSRAEIDEYYRRLDLLLDRAGVRGRVVDVRSDNGRAAAAVEVWARTLETIARK